MFGLKLASALTAMAFPVGAGALLMLASHPLLQAAVLVFGVVAGLIGLFSFADVERAEEAAERVGIARACGKAEAIALERREG